VRRYIIACDETKSLSELRTHSVSRNDGGTMSNPGFGLSTTDLKSQVRGLKIAAEKEAILRALELTNGSRKEAAKMLNISIRTLQYKIRDYAIEPGEEIPAA